MLSPKDLGKLASTYLKPSASMPSLLPAIFLWLIETIWLLASLGISDPLNLWKTQSVETQVYASVIGLTLLWASCMAFDTFEPFLLRFFEGYIGPSWIWYVLWQGRKKYEKTFDELKARLSALESEINEPEKAKSEEEKAELSKNQAEEVQCSQRLFFFFPPARFEILPTEMGNIIRAGEAYSFKRYGIDAVLMWSLLCEVLPDNSRKLLHDARQRLSCILFLSTAAGILFIQSIVTLLLLGAEKLGLPVSIGWSFLCPSLCLLVSSYVVLVALVHFSSSPASSYADCIRRSFDLHRRKLLKALHISDDPKSFSKEEREIWKTLNNCIFRGYLW